MRYFFLVFLIVLPLLTSAHIGKTIPVSKFKFKSFNNVRIPEPSGIVYDDETGHLFIVSDHGILCECDMEGKVIREAADKGMDFEGVEILNGFIYVSDETPRKVYKYRKSDLALVNVYQVTFSGGMNKAFESITYNHTKNCFVLVSQQPITICEYDTAFHLIDKQSFHIARDMSDAHWYKGDMYLLSSMDEAIFKCDAQSYTVKEKYKINVLNPEGLAFDDKGKIFITSDAMQRLYFFNNLPK